VCKCEINVGEYNTLDMVKDNTSKKHAFYFSSIFEMEEKRHTFR
jgi:hypothetical protein